MTAEREQKTGKLRFMRLVGRAVGFVSIVIDVVGALRQLRPEAADLGRAERHLAAALRALSAAAGNTKKRTGGDHAKS